MGQGHDGGMQAVKGGMAACEGQAKQTWARQADEVNGRVEEEEEEEEEREENGEERRTRRDEEKKMKKKGQTVSRGQEN